jgi:pimeloyl-ACP methyl ester carboxylesterase
MSVNKGIFCVSEPSRYTGKMIPPHNPLLRRSFLWSLPVLLGFISLVSLAQSRPEPLVAELGGNFASGTVTVSGVKMYYVRGGDGPAVILIHGFPQDWYEFHAIMPDLAKRFTVVAVDLPGIGLSAGTQNGYAAADIAKDLRGLIQELGLKRPYFVGHDIGGMVAHAFTRLFPEEARGVMILDVPLPGIQGWDQVEGAPSVWHIRFMQVPGLAEKLVTGRSADFLDYFFQFAHFTTREKEHYVSAYSSAAQLHAAFEMYRAFPANARFNASETGDISIQLFFGAGENSPFAKMVPVFARGLGVNGCRHVNTGLIPGAAHYIVEDEPAEVAELIERYAAAQPDDR